MNRKHQHGVTLMELMIVIAIVGILGAIAVPTYRNYVIRSSRSEAKAMLLQIQAAEEKFYLDNNSYTDDFAGDPPAGLGLSGTSHSGKYKLTDDAIVTANSGQTYTATVSAVAGQGQDEDTECGSFTITDSGVRGASGAGTDAAAIAHCWR
jgi:type IV pilus assembly protein PilE